MFHDGRFYERPSGKNGKVYKAEKWKEAFGYGGTNLFEAIGNENGTAKITWQRWDVVRGHRCAVLNYSLDPSHSTYVFKESQGSQAIVAYGGSVYADPRDGTIWRISDDVTQIPPGFLRIHVWGAEDYDRVTIGISQFTVLVSKSAYAETRTDATRVEWNIYNYHKFDVDSSISFQSVK